jgi:hypothetical protein
MNQESLPHRFLNRFIATLKCRVCGESYDPNRAEIVGERDNALLVRLRCHRCGEQNTVALMQRTDAPRPVRDFRRSGGGSAMANR